MIGIFSSGQTTKKILLVMEKKVQKTRIFAVIPSRNKHGRREEFRLNEGALNKGSGNFKLMAYSSKSIILGNLFQHKDPDEFFIKTVNGSIFISDRKIPALTELFAKHGYAKSNESNVQVENDFDQSDYKRLRGESF